MDRIWIRAQLQGDSCAWNGKAIRTSIVPSSSFLSCIHRMWLDLCYAWYWQENCMEYMAEQPRLYQDICNLVGTPIYTSAWVCINEGPGTLYSPLQFTHGVTDSSHWSPFLLPNMLCNSMQNAHFWYQRSSGEKSLTKSLVVHDPAQWGWEFNVRTRAGMPYWTSLPDVSEGCSLLIKCGCVVACRGHCKCYNAIFRCSTLCKSWKLAHVEW